LGRYLSLLAALLSVSCEGSHVPPWQNEKLPVEKRVEDKLRRMKPDEKLDVRTTEVPAGFPSGIEMAATWNPDLVGEEARAIAHEALALGKDQVLAPDVQSYGGDPWLAARLTVAFVGGSQENGIIATPKFFPAEPGQNERTLREMKLPPFRAAVEEAGAWSILAKGDDPYLLNDVLQKDWGFKGFLLPGVPEKQTEQQRILSALFATGYFDRQRRTDGVIDAAERSLVVRRASQQSIVLLKNDGGILPLGSPKIHTVAVIGHTAPEGIRERAGALIEVRFATGDDVQAAVELAQKSDVAVVTADKLIPAIAKANPKLIAVLTAGPVASASQWIDRAPALVTAWSPSGIADVLFGEVNPSGRLPASVDPLFPFGHGLSYTTFAYSDLKVFPATPRYGQIVQVNMNVRNTGTRAGAEVVECYVHQAKPSLERPEKELKAFSRIELKPGETKSVSMILDRRSMWYFDPAMHDWAVEPGVYEVLIGESMRDIRLKGSFELFQ
jgi:beta-glucosidase